DLRKEKKNVVDAFQRFHDVVPNLPIVAIISADDEAIAQRMLMQGAQECLSKDELDEKRLTKSIIRAVARHRYANLQRSKEKIDLEKALQQFRMVFDNAPLMIWFKDVDNRILLCNRAVAESLKLPVEQIEGRLTREFYPREADKYYSDDLDVIESGQPKLGIIERVRTGGGEILVETS